MRSGIFWWPTRYVSCQSIARPCLNIAAGYPPMRRQCAVHHAHVILHRWQKLNARPNGHNCGTYDSLIITTGGRRFAWPKWPYAAVHQDLTNLTLGTTVDIGVRQGYGYKRARCICTQPGTILQWGRVHLYTDALYTNAAVHGCIDGMLRTLYYFFLGLLSY